MKSIDRQLDCACSANTCWEVVLANPTILSVLTEWRWLWLLPQVCRAFRHGLQPERCFRVMCAADVRPVIWKSMANDLFALSCAALANVECTFVGWIRYKNKRKKTYLMRRDTVLQLALAKHGDSFAAINAAFVNRAAKLKKRREEGAAAAKMMMKCSPARTSLESTTRLDVVHRFLLR